MFEPIFQTPLADSTTDFMPVGRLPILNMFDICTPIQSADSNLPTIAVGRQQIVLVGIGLKGTQHAAQWSYWSKYFKMNYMLKSGPRV